MTDAPRRILGVEDDEDLAHAIAEQLVDAGFVVNQRHDGIAGFEAARDGDYQMIILDIMLPKRNGFSVCREQRESRLARRHRHGSA